MKKKVEGTENTEEDEQDAELAALMHRLNGDLPEIDPTFREDLRAALLNELQEQKE